MHEVNKVRVFVIVRKNAKRGYSKHRNKGDIPMIIALVVFGVNGVLLEVCNLLLWRYDTCRQFHHIAQAKVGFKIIFHQTFYHQRIIHLTFDLE